LINVLICESDHGMGDFVPLSSLLFSGRSGLGYAGRPERTRFAYSVAVNGGAAFILGKVAVPVGGPVRSAEDLE